MPDIFDTDTLVQVVPNLLTSQNWLLDRFFPNIVLADSEFIDIDVQAGKRRMSPFVSPLVEGKLVESLAYKTNRFKPPYIKDKRAPDLRRPVRRQIGERIAGEMTGEQREMENLKVEMADQMDMLNRRLEWMAAQALANAAITIEGDGFPTSVMNFGRDPLLSVSLIGTNAAWDSGSTAATPSANINAWLTDIMLLSGAGVTDLIFTGPTPYRYFLLDPAVRDAAIFNTNNFTGGPNTTNLALGAQIAHGAIFKGTWGQLNLWIYNDWYVDGNNVQNRMLPDGMVILAGPDLMGTRAFAQIMDPAFNYGPLPYAPKSWVEQDPAQRLLMMQSAPLVIPSRVNASFSATVCSPVAL